MNSNPPNFATAAGGPAGSDPFDRRPVTAVPVSYGEVWLRYLLALSLLVALWLPARLLIGHLFWPRLSSNAPRTAEAFVALAYSGISDKPTEVSPEQFRGQLRALRAAGYVPIRLSDVQTLFRDGKKLPPKAVLLTMDQSRKTSYFLTHSILRREGWNAVMFLWTKPIVDGDPAAMLWPYLRGMTHTRVWELGAQSHDGFARVPAGASGRSGHFMTTPRWRTDEQRYESVAEFEQRLRADHEQCRSLIREKLGIEPLAYAYPFGDFGQFQHHAVVVRPINMRLAAERYPLGFLVGSLALNTARSDPRRLNRLQVRPEWTGDDLVARLEQAWPRKAPLPGETQVTPPAWIADWGAAEQDAGGAVTLSAHTNATGAKMWLAGSDLLHDYSARLRFRLEAGQLGIYLRAAADDETHVYLGLDAGGDVWLRQVADGRERLPVTEQNSKGDIWLRQKLSGTARFTLASAYAPLAPGREHVLDILLRDRFFSARLDGRELFRDRNVLRGELRPGLIGLSVWSPEQGAARAVIQEMDVREIAPTVAVWDADRQREITTIAWINEHAFRLTDLSPRWLDASAAGPAKISGGDLENYRLLARVHRLRLRPEVYLPNEAALRRVPPTLLAERMERARVDGVQVNLTDMPPSALPTFVVWLRQAAAALAEKGSQLLIRLPPVLESAAQIHSLLAVVPSAQVAVGATSDVPLGPIGASGRVVRAESVPEPAPEDPLPLSFMIQTGREGSPVENDEARASRLQQEGMAAYLDGQYVRAAEIWREWRKLEPDNPKASMLIGDALSRLGDLKQAVQEYDRSLALDPGQLSLAIRRAEFYEAMGDPERTAESLNLYSRLFPGNADVLLAQARWLSEHERAAEASVLVRKVSDLDPDNVEALALLLHLPSTPEERSETMRRLVTAGADPRNHLALAQAVWKYALTARPDAEPLVALLADMESRPLDPRVAEILDRVRPQTRVVSEDFSGGAISKSWWIEGARLDPRAGGGLHLLSGETYTEGSLRLLGSLRLRNAFVEAVVGEMRGSFWLFTGRTPAHMARFGYTDDGYLHLQTWSGGRLLAERKVEFARPAGPVRFRLEARGDGMMGFVDQRPVFDARVPLPPDAGFGWAGVAVYASERGRAAAELSGLSAGPAPLRLGVMPPVATDAEADAQLGGLRADVTQLTALCPAGFVLDAVGAWVTPNDRAREISSLLARYHRLWLTPFVECRAPAARLTPAALQQRAEELGVDGFILMFRDAPGDAWLAEMRQAFRDSPLRLLVAVTERGGREARMEPVGRGSEFAPGPGAALRVHIARRSALGAALPAAGDYLIGY